MPASDRRRSAVEGRGVTGRALHPTITATADYADPSTAATFDDRRFGGPIGDLVAATQAPRPRQLHRANSATAKSSTSAPAPAAALLLAQRRGAGHRRGRLRSRCSRGARQARRPKASTCSSCDRRRARARVSRPRVRRRRVPARADAHAAVAGLSSPSCAASPNGCVVVDYPSRGQRSPCSNRLARRVHAPLGGSTEPLPRLHGSSDRRGVRRARVPRPLHAPSVRAADCAAQGDRIATPDPRASRAFSTGRPAERSSARRSRIVAERCASS